ncbi:F-box/FBD/LRR-repeat protein At1g13570-like isoform X2 [Nicotiana tabacum]|uniref:F-box/FBD/LRR-repeat protein At1g13570-like isoform X2 n=2 Tax=Nicotiana TaxID=4085 RepID=A0A1S3YIE4_TOBAC|nr:PREDICTED: F-box/FBD/LRR-repeat protein At1g13570-like isoform X1 [Nicotiana sylvestris]XP_016452021.1 PREDICTED: F-box/FBD/LRR-repeat protein At1g13570-like isoform X2 [Nicotiana tabacum]
MMPPKHKKHSCESLPTNLPENVINAILMRLPLRDAVRTSILSKQWRYKWCRLPQLTLDDKIWKTTNNLLSPSIKFTNIMYNILTLHSGPITKFTLSMSELKKYPKIDSLIYFLSRNGIEHLVVQFSEWNLYKLPSSFFTCSQLRHLTLQNCLICPPPAFKGFNMLISLELCHVSVSSISLESLISSSPYLENLVLKISDTLSHIQIKAPLKYVPHLTKLSLMYGESYEDSEKCDLDKFLQSFPVLEHLHLEYGSSQVSMDESDNEVDEVSASFSDVTLNHLRTVKVEGITCTMLEMQLVKLLLANAPMLVRMLIEPGPYYAYTEAKILAEFTKYQRASPKAEIVVRDY